MVIIVHGKPTLTFYCGMKLNRGLDDLILHGFHQYTGELEMYVGQPLTITVIEIHFCLHLTNKEHCLRREGRERGFVSLFDKNSQITHSYLTVFRK